MREQFGPSRQDPQAGPLLRLEVRHPGPDITVIAVGGEVDLLTAPRLDACLAEELASGCGELILDLSHVEFLGAAGLEVIARAARGCERAQLVCGPRVARVLALTGLAGGITVHDTVEVAEKTAKTRAGD
ncbi:STAS domain-containing protein [Amycolatopsis acidicola]|uniref:Anti-sigma factor antagonist n=1 Tax=Amycolatopsis acidicola TaxID=2596893 RepID=A0A5N0USS0_9PSEU|nr:STAS domain-containing protein [Amycolatopsis acidicola]KAA9153893.1 STAS domain-containing protein [Amycolatopsis acidicola]